MTSFPVLLLSVTDDPLLFPLTVYLVPLLFAVFATAAVAVFAVPAAEDATDAAEADYAVLLFAETVPAFSRSICTTADGWPTLKYFSIVS